MYLDKLYTKLYSNKDWDGLNQLISEVRSFARKDYEGLDPVTAGLKRNFRDMIAENINQERKMVNDKVKDYEGLYNKYKMRNPTEPLKTPIELRNEWYDKLIGVMHDNESYADNTFKGK